LVRIAVISNTEVPLVLFDPATVEDQCLFVSDDPRLVRKARRRGFRTARGDLREASLYRRVAVGPEDRVLVHLNHGKDLARCLRSLLEVEPNAPVTVLLDPGVTPPEFWRDDVLYLPANELGSVCVRTEMEKAATRRSLASIRTLFRGAERVLLLVQDDPDPDGLASALALRALLGRNRLTAVIGAFGEITRPENVAMSRLLDIHIHRMRCEDLPAFDRIALLDVQPFHSPDVPTQVDLVIDHHPRRTNYSARLKDIRPRYGATSTIMTEYLVASDTPISQRLATALLYGIKTDTQLLGRDTTPMDVAAFASLYPLANHGLLRQIDRPQFPRGDLPALSLALHNADIVDDILFAYMGPLSRADVIPYIADFCLEVEGLEWSVVSGLSEGKLIISVRNYGSGRSAGEVMKAAFEPYGSAGGHKAMAKAVIPLDQIPLECLDHESWVRDRFLVSLYERHGTGSGEKCRAAGP
jgi:nanoRNase/pAp phosphatase (c-di-AMP/oligoRNAs hydrolase)